MMSTRERAGYIALTALLVFVFGLIPAMEAAAFLSCGRFASLSNQIVSPLVFLITQDSAQFGTVVGCSIPAPALDGAVIVLLALLVVLAVVGAVLWQNWKHSTRYFMNDLRARDGFARAREIKKTISARAVLAQAGTLRPALVETGRTIVPRDVGMSLGSSRGVPVYVSVESSMCLWGPPRSGKGFRIIIGAIIDAPGAVVTTSTRPDNLHATLNARAVDGRPIVVFDPQGVTGIPGGKKWSPIIGSEDPEVATRRAKDILGGSAATDGNNADWAAASATIAAGLLHAVAVGGRGIEQMRAWTSSPGQARFAIDDLAMGGAPGWAERLKGVLDADPRMVDSNWHSLKMAFDPLFLPKIAESMSPAEGEEFDAIDFINRRGTLYLVGTGVGVAAVGGFLSAMMNDVVEAARKKAMTQKGGRLDPPLTLVLDEIANMFAWPELPMVLADGGGQGVSTMVVLQSLSQARSGWSAAQADTIWEASNVKVLLGGAAAESDLENFSKLLGPRTIKKHSFSESSRAGVTYNTQDEDVPLIRADELRRLPDGVGVLVFKNMRGVLLDLAAWIDRADASEISAGKKTAETQAHAALRSSYGDYATDQKDAANV